MRRKKTAMTPEEAPEQPAHNDQGEDQRSTAVDVETGEPTIDNEMIAKVATDPHNATPEDAGAAIIKGLDALQLMLTPAVRRRQPELGVVFQLYAAERPGIIERQKRLAARQNQS